MKRRFVYNARQLEWGDTMFKMLSAVLFLALIGLGSVKAAEPQHSPYVGQEQRDIKALSPEEVKAYLSGKGMGLAKVAELNHYPGPAHVLALSGQLALTPEQREQTEALAKTMEENATALGRQLIDEERNLDGMFANRTITKVTLRQALEIVAMLQAKIRQAHLQAHLGQVEILKPEQIKRYDELRGYTEVSNAPSIGHQHRH